MKSFLLKIGAIWSSTLMTGASEKSQISYNVLGLAKPSMCSRLRIEAEGVDELETSYTHVTLNFHQ
eukprot:IDg10347t1